MRDVCAELFRRDCNQAADLPDPSEQTPWGTTLHVSSAVPMVGFEPAKEAVWSLNGGTDGKGIPE